MTKKVLLDNTTLSSTPRTTLLTLLLHHEGSIVEHIHGSSATPMMTDSDDASTSSEAARERETFKFVTLLFHVYRLFQLHYPSAFSTQWWAVLRCRQAHHANLWRLAVAQI